MSSVRNRRGVNAPQTRLDDPPDIEERVKTLSELFREYSSSLLMMLGLSVAFVLVVLGISGMTLYLVLKLSDDSNDDVVQCVAPHLNGEDDWHFDARDVESSRAGKGVVIDKNNVDSLTTKFILPHIGTGVSSTPTTKGDYLCYTSWEHHIRCVSRSNGGVYWEHDLRDLTNSTDAISRSSPAHAVTADGNDVVVITDLGATINNSTFEVSMYIFDLHVGNLLHRVTLSTNPFHSATFYPVAVSGRAVFGLSSEEVILAKFVANYTCCSSVGYYGVVLLGSGTIDWVNPTIRPDRVAEGYSGAGVWHGSPSVDIETGSVIITTGQLYSRPASVEVCLSTPGNTPNDCLPDGIDTMAILRVNLFTGAVEWRYLPQGPDVYNLDCLDIPPFGPMNSNGNCDYVKQRTDYDFSSSGIIIHHRGIGGKAVFATQKSNVAHLINFETGEKIWVVLPGGYTGGILHAWGNSYDEKLHRFYMPSPNYHHRTVMLPNGKRLCDGYVSGIDAETGRTIWMTEHPNANIGSALCGDPLRDPDLDHIDFDHGGNLALPPIPSSDYYIATNVPSSFNHFFGPVAYANGLVYTTSSDGHLYVFEANSGVLVHSHNTGSSIYGGVMIVGDMVCFGTGYNPPPLSVDVRFDADNGALICLTL